VVVGLVSFIYSLECEWNLSRLCTSTVSFNPERGCCEKHTFSYDLANRASLGDWPRSLRATVVAISHGSAQILWGLRAKRDNHSVSPDKIISSL
jgi:hypothetical protein